MKPSLPLSWIGTTTRARDQGLFHLEATLVRDLKGARLMVGGIQVGTADSYSTVVPACGTRVFACSGSFPDGSPTVSPGSRCHKCEAMAEKLRPIYCRCPNDACKQRETVYARSQMVADLECPACGRFKLSEFLPVPR